MGTAVPPNGAIYVSAPITTGRRYAEWMSTPALRPEGTGADVDLGFVREVVQPNRARARRAVDELRRAGRGIVIDPAALNDVPGWGQDDYRCLWAEVISRFASRVVFVDGWEFSSGCAYEFLVSMRLRIPVESECGERLGWGQGSDLLHAAIIALQQGALDVAFLRWVGDEIRSVGASLENEKEVGRL
jgi:hypothetical protein